MRQCISLGTTDFDRSIFEKHDFFEFRLDLAELQDLLPLAKESIATNHKNPTMLEGIDATYVDLDHTAPRIDTNSKIIRSHHDFEKTPEKDELLRFIHKHDDSVIKKVACKIVEDRDLETLFSLFDERDNLVVVPMGDPKHRMIETRTLWTYVSFGVPTGLGQISFNESL